MVTPVSTVMWVTTASKEDRTLVIASAVIAMVIVRFAMRLVKQTVATAYTIP